MREDNQSALGSLCVRLCVGCVSYEKQATCHRDRCKKKQDAVDTDRINNCSFIRHSVCLRVCVGVNTVCDLCGSFWLHAGRCGALRSEDGWMELRERL